MAHQAAKITTTIIITIVIDGDCSIQTVKCQVLCEHLPGISSLILIHEVGDYHHSHFTDRKTEP